jgi:hypothetical protein
MEDGSNALSGAEPDSNGIAAQIVHTSHDSSPSIVALPSMSPLEALPAELRLQILFNLSNVADLKAVVHASPVFHQQYLLDRQRLFGRALETALGDAFVDAYAVQTSTYLDRLDGELPRATVVQFLSEYRDFRLDSGAVLRKCTIEDLASMAAFYQGVIRPLLEYCPAFLLSKFETTTGTQLRVGELSTTERTRFLRSFYRFQLLCNLFNSKRPISSFEGFSHYDILLEFLVIFNPWEADEVACIARLIKSKYQQALEAVKWDLPRDNPGFSGGGQPDTPPRGFYLDQEGKPTIPATGTSVVPSVLLQRWLITRRSTRGPG